MGNVKNEARKRKRERGRVLRVNDKTKTKQKSSEKQKVFTKLLFRFVQKTKKNGEVEGNKIVFSS